MKSRLLLSVVVLGVGALLTLRVPESGGDESTAHDADASRSPTAAEAPPLPRDFSFDVPLFAADSAWNQSAGRASVLPGSESQVLVTYRVLMGDSTTLYPPVSADWLPVTWVNHDEYTMPIFRAGSGRQEVLICDYEGQLEWPSPRFGVDKLGGPVPVPRSVGPVRPASPPGRESDGSMVLYSPDTGVAFDFWQATTERRGVCRSRGAGRTGTEILEAGAVEFFDVRGAGANDDTLSSARAVGTPLLAGLILPEDVERGAVGHALASAFPGLRNTGPDHDEPTKADYFYPASTTETDYYDTNPDALAAGQRLRLKDHLVDDAGRPVDEDSLAPITKMILEALRSYGAYPVDNAGGFIFYAEESQTAVLHLPDADVNRLIGEAPGEPLPAGMTSWEIVMERLNEELVAIPFAYGPWTPGQDPATATIDYANFEVVEPAFDPRLATATSTHAPGTATGTVPPAPASATATGAGPTAPPTSTDRGATPTRQTELTQTPGAEPRRILLPWLGVHTHG